MLIKNPCLNSYLNLQQDLPKRKAVGIKWDTNVATSIFAIEIKRVHLIWQMRTFIFVFYTVYKISKTFRCLEKNMYFGGTIDRNLL